MNIELIILKNFSFDICIYMYNYYLNLINDKPYK